MRSIILLNAVVAVLAVPYSEYILAPSTRNISPVSVLGTNGDVQDAASLTIPQAASSAVFNGVSSVVYDFGKNIAGYITFDVESLSDDALHAFGVTFTESSLWINDTYCDGVQDVGLDLPLVFDVSAPGQYQAPPGRERGGFRYITFVHNSTGSATVANLTVLFTPEPSMQDPANYTGYFNSDNEKLNRVWYAGVYTNQLCTIDPTAGSALQIPTDIWYYNATISNGTSVLVDGGKRDRIVWPGDIFVSGPSIFVSTGNSESIRNGINSLLQIQNDDGKLPYCGDPFHALLTEAMGTYAWSFTYHLYSLIDIYDYYIFTGDLDYVKQTWTQFKLAMKYSLSTIDSSGLANVTSSADWLRFGMGGHNIEVSCLVRLCNIDYKFLIFSTRQTPYSTILLDSESSSPTPSAIPK
ncbi:hypothetical protein PVAG01_07842 [Phlyctema vagabunda]|uniref:Alpha-L-rhamnosidase six-hairpin glycosidase domain-containing protein n=1 Tax=Phlyctema vagabunda TaxID=108571 RepID=A0ABR4PDM6_9HELO